MIYYSDVIIEKNLTPKIEFEITNNYYLNSLINIKRNEKIIYSGKITNNFNSIVIDSYNENFLSNYKVEIIKNKKIIWFPVTILNIEAGMPIIICDIDFTLSATNIIKFITNNLLQIKTISNSVEILQKLSKKFQIIYLTGRLEKYTKLTKIWIEINKYPKGPIIARKKNSVNNLKIFKTKALKNITRITKNIIGIGDQNSDIRAYLANHIIPIKIINSLFLPFKKEKYILKNNYYIAYSWNSIFNIFINNNFFF